MDLPKPECDEGYTHKQIEEITGDHLEAFWKWMVGQTMCLCDGRRYNHKTKEYEKSCGPHGPIVYSWDLERYLRGLPPLD